jgi:hypothetical protein
LSANVAELCLLAITGRIHALSAPTAAAATLSVRDTAIASNPLKAGSPRLAETFDVRFA